MKKNNKDFFETILGDVVPLKKLNKNKEHLSINKDIINKEKNQQPEKTYETQNFIHTKKENISKKKHETDIVENNRSFLKKIKQEKILINKKIDLHGHTLIEAEKIFNDEISLNYRTDKRCLLFITGKGMLNRDRGDTSTKLYFGKIRSNIHLWAKKNNNKSKILFFAEALYKHGGPGSFYVYLRKG